MVVLSAVKRWTVEITIDEHENERRTHAKALLAGTGRPTPFRGDGTAHRRPYDQDVPETGDELAVARALAELSHRLLEAVAADQERSPA
jgi:hypothetical protein